MISPTNRKAYPRAFDKFSMASVIEFIAKMSRIAREFEQHELLVQMTIWETALVTFDESAESSRGRF